MSISAKCRKCGRRYSVKDEHAGKKFRCKECQAPVAVPKPQVLEADVWEAEDASAGFDYEDYDDYDTGYAPPPPRRAPRKKAPAAPKKKKRPRKRSSGSNSASMAGRICGGLLVGLVVMGAVLRAVNGLDLGGSWQSYTTPDGNITMQMPGRVKSVPVRQMAPGGQSFGAERRRFACIVVIEPMPAELNGLTENEMFDAIDMGSRFLGASNVQRSQINGRPCVTFEQPPQAGVHISALAFVHKNKIYTLNYAYKGSKGSNGRKFFDSVKFH